MMTKVTQFSSISHHLDAEWYSRDPRWLKTPLLTLSTLSRITNIRAMITQRRMMISRLSHKATKCKDQIAAIKEARFWLKASIFTCYRQISRQQNLVSLACTIKAQGMRDPSLMKMIMRVEQISTQEVSTKWWGKTSTSCTRIQLIRYLQVRKRKLSSMWVMQKSWIRVVQYLNSIIR